MWSQIWPVLIPAVVAGFTGLLAFLGGRMDSRRRIKTEIALLKDLQELDGNEASKQLLEEHLHASIVYFMSYGEAFRELRKVMIFATITGVGYMIGLAGFVAKSVADLGKNEWVADILIGFGWAGIAAPGAIFLILAVIEEIGRQKRERDHKRKLELAEQQESD